MRKKTLQELMKERANQSTDTSAYTEKEMPKSTQQRYIMPQEQSTWNKIQERANQILNNTFSTFSNNKNFTRFNYEKEQRDKIKNGQNVTMNLLPTREGLKQQNQYFGKGNIDLNNRKIAKNEDGSISTVRSMSFYDDKEKKEILVPTVINGKVVSDDEAIDHYYNTGEYLGKFDTVKEANQYAENLHNEQEKQYSIKNNAILAKADEMNELYKKNIVNRVSNKVSDTLQKTLQTPENLKNGYQFGDLSTTAMSTLLGGTAHAIEGVKSVGDAIANHGAYAVASVADITGNHDFSERLINAIQLNNEDTQNITQQINDIFDKSSVLGQTGNKALESFGQSKVFGILGQKSEALKEAGKIGQSKAMKAFADSLVYTMGANAGFDEAYNQANTTGWEAILKATGGGLSSYISKNINDVFGYGGNKVTKNVKEKFENIFKSGMAKAFAKLGFSSISEGAEEIVEDFLNTKVVNNIVNKVIEEKKYNTEINLEDSIENAVIAMVSVWAGGTPTTIQEGRQIQRNQEIINNSNLTDEQKTNLTQFAEEKNLNNEQIQKAIEMTENQATTMQNNKFLNQEQQTIQQEGKQAQNQLSQETDNIEQKVIKNQENTIENNIKPFKELVEKAKYIPQEEKNKLLKEVDSKSSLDEFKNLVNDMNNVYKEENTLNTKETYSTGRKEKYQKYLNSKTEYDNSALKNAMEIIPANNQGRRTKEQWLNVAKQIGTEIADKSNAEIEEIAFRTWQDERPSSKESMNRKGQKYVPFNSDEWVNAIYDSVNEQREKFSIETENQENKLETTQPVEQKEEKPSRKTLNPTEISNIKPEQASTTPELYSKQYKEGTKESEFAKNIENKVGFLTEEQRKEILKDDNIKYYAPVTNAETLGKAYQDLKENGQNATLEWYSKDGKTSSAEDVAKGWILLKQYADKGDTQGMVNVAKKLRDMGTKAGQTVQAFNILSRLTPEGMVAYTQGELQDAYNEMIKGKSKKWIDEHKSDFDLSQEEVAFIMDTMQNLPAENPDTNNYERKVALGQIQKLFTDKIPVEGGKIKAWMRISMLFNPKTQVRNVAGNVGIVPVNAVADFLGSKVDKAVAKKTGVRTLGNPNVKSYLKGAKQGLYQSYNDFRLGINTRGLEGSKFEFGEGKSFKDKGIGKALNRTENILNFVMDAGDRAFSQGSFTNSLNNQMVLNGVDTPTQEMIDIATQEALSRTWNDNNEYTNFVLGIRKGLNKIGTKNYGLGDVLIPFAKTPANLTKAIVDYSPVGLVNAIKEGNNLKNAIETGQFTPMQQHKFVDSLGKALAGTMLYVIGYGLAKAGIATGEADEDKDVKNFMKNSLGIGSYSIKIGNKSFAYDWAQPVATPIAIMTNLYQTNKNNSDATILEKALNAVNIGTNQIMEQSFMDSLNEVLNGNGEITERLQKAVLDLPARAIPTFSKQIADLVDSTQRTSFEYGKPLQSSINAVKAKIPFASKTLTPVVDTLGNEVKRYGGENNVFNVFLNPANMNKGQLSKAGKEIYNVYMQTGDTTVFPVTAPYYVNYKGDKLTMTAQERADYQRISGKYTEEVMNKLLNNSNYKSLSDEDKAEIISKVVNDSNSKAKKDVLDIPNKDIDKIEKIGSNYYDYKLDTKKALDKKRQETGKTTTQLTDNEKISVLKNKNYSKKEKDLLYTNEIGDDDTVYTSMKLLNGNSLSFIDSYFDYKMGSKKSDDLKQFLNNNNQLTYMQKLYLTGVNNSSLNSTERQKLKNYIYSLNITEQQRKTMENKLKFTTEMKDGSYKWK